MKSTLICLFSILLLVSDLRPSLADLISSSQVQTCIQDANHPNDLILGCSQKFVVTMAINNGQDVNRKHK